MNRSIHRGAVMAVPFVALLSACGTAQQHAADVAAARDAGDRLSVGTVQREIRTGMSSAEVIAALGAPNIVTTDEQRREHWVYDRISTETVHAGSSGGVSTLLLGGFGGSAGIAGVGGQGGFRSGAGATSRSQRTLTIVVKFDGESRVRDFAYRTSSF